MSVVLTHALQIKHWIISVTQATRSRVKLHVRHTALPDPCLNSFHEDHWSRLTFWTGCRWPGPTRSNEVHAAPPLWSLPRTGPERFLRGPRLYTELTSGTKNHETQNTRVSTHIHVIYFIYIIYIFIYLHIHTLKHPPSHTYTCTHYTHSLSLKHTYCKPANKVITSDFPPISRHYADFHHELEPELLIWLQWPDP